MIAYDSFTLQRERYRPSLLLGLTDSHGLDTSQIGRNLIGQHLLESRAEEMW